MASMHDFEMETITGNPNYRSEVLAWALACHRDAALRDPERAVAFAEEAAVRPGNGWLSWFVLAAASVRSDRHERALEVLKRLQPFQGQRGDIAMACAGIRALANHHLGRAEEAREWRDQALHLPATDM